MPPSEDSAFTDFLLQKAIEAQTSGYNPVQLKKMLGEHRGNATVRQLLSSGKASVGFTRLRELGRLDLTVEALVVETSEKVV